MSSMDERELWNDAIKKKAASQIWFRAYMVGLGLLVAGVVVYIAFFQIKYQTDSRQITEARNAQLQNILQSSEETKAYIRCAVKLRSTDNANNVDTLLDCVKSETVKLPQTIANPN